MPDARTTKNRLHFDLRPREGTRDEEVERVRGLGATEVGDHRGKYGPGTGWVVLADPEGNEFCILRSQAEVDAGSASRVTCRTDAPVEDLVGADGWMRSVSASAA